MLQIMDALDLDKAVIGGTSWGGLAGAEAALQVPDRAQALLLINTPMLLDARAPGLKSRAITLGARYGLKTGLFRSGVAKSFFSDDTRADRDGYMSHFHDMLRTANPTELSMAVRSVLLNSQPLRDRLADIKPPTLVIAGAHDDMYPLAVQAEAAAHLPNGRFETVEGRHISAVDAPGDVAQLIENFVETRAA